MYNKTDETMFKQSKVEPLFNLVKNQETKKVIICVGNYKISSKEFNNFGHAEKYIATKPYELIINTSVLFVKLNENEKNINKNPQNK